ncbi:MAPEG family protein [Pseudophaeobacter sp. 1A16562]|uniref:MAPEG family protein n=1 Tax=Rhodobacterales TaxID=204455 RepID=UPI00237F258D|nr:MAPEG family protein [Phaeobacter gallaeciensis]MDE4097822.1 MAPEG family protein [Phaeobacter gallaeciensis]MDE4106340.1 MAPEG family protein [Phaeobacter gallaeciensis]MDE4111086.1 MAPEG family protein [Phaeobacter gallaeciensis]MDE4115265.1 MAPEG family protein [Phaeobacter gallaeciensis]MDE4119734.1 MAPEG family protein [Phaeobacter gallaeciensis]
MLPITSLYAGGAALLFVYLSLGVSRQRLKHKISVGDGGNRALLMAIRAQGNFVEYTALGLVLLALSEAQGAPALATHALGVMLLGGRLMHAVGFTARPQILILRQAGIVLNLLMLLVAGLGLIAHALF